MPSTLEIFHLMKVDIFVCPEGSSLSMRQHRWHQISSDDKISSENALTSRVNDMLNHRILEKHPGQHLSTVRPGKTGSVVVTERNYLSRISKLLRLMKHFCFYNIFDDKLNMTGTPWGLHDSSSWGLWGQKDIVSLEDSNRSQGKK